MSRALDPSEWIEVGHVAVRTRSVLEAGQIAAKVSTSRQRGIVHGVEWMCLASFRELRHAAVTHERS